MTREVGELAQAASRRASAAARRIEGLLSGSISVRDWNEMDDDERSLRDWNVLLSDRTRALILAEGIELERSVCEAVEMSRLSALRSLIPDRFIDPALALKMAALARDVALDVSDLSPPESTAAELISHHLLITARQSAPLLIGEGGALSETLAELDYADDVLFDPPDALALWDDSVDLREIQNSHPDDWFRPF